MKRFSQVAAVILWVTAISASGQSRADIEAKFGKAADEYSVTHQILMRPMYSSDGQVCRMTFSVKRFSSGAPDLSLELPFEQFRKAVDSIVPLSTRGDKKDPFDQGGWTAGGGLRWATFSYEFVSIVYAASFRVNFSKGFGREFTFSAEAVELYKQQREPETKQDDFFEYRDSTAETVTVVWNNRQCST